MRRKLGQFMIELGTVLLLLALSLFLYNQWEASRAQEAASQVVSQISVVIEDNAAYSAYIEEGSGETTVEIDGYSYIGTLDIPKFGLELPVQEEWSYAGLKIAPGRYSGSAATHDLVICAHNYERHFGRLSEMETGDTIIFTAVDGTVYTYEVTEIFTLEPTGIDTLLNGDWDLCLYTCTYGGQARVVVRCKLAAE